VHLLASPKLAEELPSLDRNVSLVVEPLLDAASRFTRLVWWHREFLSGAKDPTGRHPLPLAAHTPERNGSPVSYVVISENLLLFDNADFCACPDEGILNSFFLRVLHARSLKYADGWYPD